MILGKVIGNIWATKKEESLNGYKLMVVDIINSKGLSIGEELIAIDTISSGIGDTVIVSKGNSARVFGNTSIAAPIDAAIIAIVDEVE